MRDERVVCLLAHCVGRRMVEEEMRRRRRGGEGGKEGEE